MKLHLVVLVVTVVATSGRSSSLELLGNNELQFATSCPNDADIRPCECIVSSDGFSLDMDCSKVQDEEQLKAVFQADFPTSAFRRFTIHQNKQLRILRDGTFNYVTFEEIWITDGILEKIEDAALSDSASTARNLIFNLNNISIFPFSILSNFEELLSLDLRVNNLQGFPKLTSSTLKILYLSHNPLGSLPVDAFGGTPSITDLHLSNTKITEILPGTLQGLPKLRNIGLGNNQLKELVENSVQCNSNTGLVDLGYNELRTVHPNAFPGFRSGWLYIHHNYITTLEENVWRILVEHDGYLDPYGNPLLCGCDIAWLLNNATLRDAVDKYTTCADGRKLIDLNPTDYDHC
ncbi:oplophorus-luciferin 2-monooxygenase non-catalytic subunit-like isoform X2 [Portunus trituberculatus]|nr:oplophorus-luciferin 2-monooxygenase non-catalytic subunit-like isoform X2 [Portunus trituberculatus]XP_045130392.1 oplophorus-luciferin 2-monooxygenase non-catalytic subunit-like isoform X2 [Portunus trituberculatus]XP_045130393.1 oplophorus-luciferin 2-monooxygenase non-catalytic subunit-like isoform X2 [Portunus trituberculatus]XP_045130394.1 oplophorus-luciferin 2-monooxygenase non-catalytic subunit-like isoform X2 [Portunus trituberculatus]